ncbi:fructose-bisphosphate aldolase class I, partial [Mesorhizobium sp. M2A.F.Ca.ET.046.02.1.1]
MSERLEDIATAMVSGGKGLLAADESSGTIKKRFDVIGVESTADNRRDYREMMFRAKEAMSNYISGVILFDETIRQKAADGTPLVDIIKAAGSIPGIKVDLGAKPLAGFPGDTITEGLDGLRERLADYYKLGARFAKWRAVIDIDTGKGVPSANSIASNTHALARYAALCQEAGIVPIVEPEVLMDGAHSIDTCYDVTKATLVKLYDELYAARVVLEGSILKPNMVISGKKSGRTDSPEEIAEKTIKLFREVVPAAVPGIAFLSGGQEDEEATANLNAINAIGPHPWKLTL